MAKISAQQIVDDIEKYVGSGGHPGWYAGIAKDPRDCLFSRHGVDEQNGSWIYRTAISVSGARAAESALHADGFDGGPGGGDESTNAVYAYKKTGTTSED